MTTATKKIDGASTAKWPQAQFCSVLIDPFILSNPNGGHRPVKLKDIKREKKLVIVSGRDQRSINEFKAIMISLAKSNWSDNEQYEVRTAFDVDSVMMASGGYHKRKPKPTESEVPMREISGINTPAPRKQPKEVTIRMTSSPLLAMCFPPTDK
jgi:hypothetical protein